MDSSISEHSARDESDLVDSDLSESQLRDLYETAEIRRFLHIFSTYVSEVKIKKTEHEGLSTPLEPLSRQPSSSGSYSSPLETEGKENTSSISQAYNGDEKSISGYIVEHYASPLLPAQRREIPPFTLSRTHLTLSRLYIIGQIYWPHIGNVWDLATWTSFGTSFVCCTAYWILWWYNFLLPSLVLLVLAALLGRGIFPYPSVEDLREYYRRVGQANEFSDQFSSRLSPASKIGLRELFRLYRLAYSNWHRKPKQSSKKGKSPSTESINIRVEDSDNEGKSETSPPPDDATLLDDPEETKAALELRRWLLYFWTEVADLNERLRNIYIWRRPAASRRYTIATAFVFLVTAFVPTQYLAKGFWLAIGAVFWHVTPIVCALSPDDRSRIPPLFADVPTDAEHAMDLMSSRIAKGEDLQALREKHAKGSSLVKTAKSETAWGPPKGSHSKLKAIGKLISEEGSRAAKEAMPLTVASHPLFVGAMAILLPEANAELHTYAGQHRSSPGLITLTMKRLIFTPFLSPQSNIEIDVERITGVKKNGVLKGLHVSHRCSSTNSVAEEKFLWISGRDELFARLLAMGNKKWVNV